jgi:uncharacterized protein
MATSPSARSERRVVITGASGLIGRALVDALQAAGHPVTRLVRRAPTGDDRSWDPAAGTIDKSAIEGAWAVVHLAGEGIADAKWTDAHKRSVLDSRVKGTTLLANTIASVDRKPSVFASGSAVGFYGDRGDEVLTEASAGGTGFLADVVQAWEAAAGGTGVRTAFLRTGVVLSTRGGALKPQLLPFKLGLGGRLGSGRQYFPWITLGDEVRAIRHVLDTEAISGPVNLVAPELVTNAEFTKALGSALHRPTLLPIPLLPLKLRFGAEMVQEMMLGGARIQPGVLESTGFVFEHPNLADALTSVLSVGA